MPIEPPPRDPNPYAAPQADVQTKHGQARSDAPLYYTMSPAKLAAMISLTMGLYSLVWFYRHWHAIRERFEEDIWPIPRALFGVISCFWLTKRLQERLASQELPPPPGLASAAMLYFALSLGGNVLGRFDTVSTHVLSTLLVPLTAIALVPVQQAANASTAAAGVQEFDNRGLQVSTVLGACFGLTLWGFWIATILDPTLADG